MSFATSDSIFTWRQCRWEFMIPQWSATKTHLIWVWLLLSLKTVFRGAQTSKSLKFCALRAHFSGFRRFRRSAPTGLGPSLTKNKSLYNNKIGPFCCFPRGIMVPKLAGHFATYVTCFSKTKRTWKSLHQTARGGAWSNGYSMTVSAESLSKIDHFELPEIACR